MMSIDIDLLLKVGISILTLTLITFPKFYNEFKFLKKDKLKDDYKFAEQIIKNDEYKTLHCFLLEKAFFTLLNFKFTSNEIKFFLEQNNPMKKFDDYTKCYKYIEVVSYDENLSLQYKSSYSSNVKRKWMSRGYNILYFILAGIAMIPIVNIQELLTQSLSMIIIGFFLSIYFITMAFTSLTVALNLKKSNLLLEDIKEVAL